MLTSTRLGVLRITTRARSDALATSVQGRPDDRRRRHRGRDRRFFAEWVAFGVLELTVYPTRYAEFEAYCERRDSHIA
jgi:hypothetical protein